MKISDRDHLLAHVARAEIKTWSKLGHMAHVADSDRSMRDCVEGRWGEVDPGGMRMVRMRHEGI